MAAEDDDCDAGNDDDFFLRGLAMMTFGFSKTPLCQHSSVNFALGEVVKCFAVGGAPESCLGYLPRLDCRCCRY
jgi:hypothetical protein